MKPVVLLTVTGTEALPPTVTGKVAALVLRLKASVVGVTGNSTCAEFDELVGVMVTSCGPDAAMFGAVAIVNVVVALSVPSKVTLPGLKLQVAPAGGPWQ